MTHTYCGKNCESCTWLESGKCHGCRSGAGRYGGVCELAGCCAKKGHDTCETCGFKGGCRLLLGRESQPEARIKKAEAKRREQARKAEEERNRKERMASRAEFFARWLRALFWMVVPMTLAGILDTDWVRESKPGAYRFGLFLGAACSLIYGLLLLKASSQEEKYRTAGSCSLISSAAGLLTYLNYNEYYFPNWLLIIIVPAAIVSLIGEYCEYKGHANVAGEMDRELSRKWISLWKWFIGSMAATLLGGLFSAVSSGLAVFIMMLGALGLVVAGILKLVFLYQTAALCKKHSGYKY